MTSSPMTPDGLGARARVDTPDAPPQLAKLAPETADRIARALGQGLAQCWSRLAQDVQHDVFEATVTLEGETIRQELAVYLHGKHTRTTDALHARATSEPDSLGG